MKKKFLTILLAITIFLSSVPLGIFGIFEVHANPQAAVNPLNIADSSTANAFRINLLWHRPPTLRDSGGPPANWVGNFPHLTNGDGSWESHRAISYDVMVRDATTRTPFVRVHTMGSFAEPIEDDLISFTYPNAPHHAPMLPGRIYSFRVDAAHRHTTVARDPDTGLDVLTPSWVWAPVAEASEALFLSDLEVRAESTGDGSITVHWSNPTFDGMNAFPAYAIRYALGDNANQEIILSPATPRREVRTENLLPAVNGMWSYTIIDSNIQIGSTYTVSVEPMVMVGNTLRELRIPAIEGQPMRTVRIGDRDFNMTFRSVVPGNNLYTSVVSIVPRVRVTEDGPDFLRISWPPLRMPGISRVEVQRSETGTEGSFATIGTIRGTANEFIVNTSWRDPRPAGTGPWYYRILIHFDGATPPRLPLPSPPERYDPPDQRFSPTRPVILEITHQGEGADNLSLDVTWQAFERPPINTDEEREAQATSTGRFLDLNVLYDIWITDDLSLLTGGAGGEPIIPPVVRDLAGNSLTAFYDTFDVLGGSEVAAFNHLFTEFHAATGGRNYELRPIADNRVYYVRIVARRDPQITSVSEPAYGSYFFPPVGPIGTRPPIMARPPLRIVREELDALTMQWKTQWFEAYDSTQNEWHSEIGVTTTNQIVFGDAITQAIRDANRVLDLSDYTTATAARTAIRALGVSVANSDELRLPLRSLDLRDAGYEIYVAAYNSVSDQIDNLGYNRFVETVLSQANWVGIEPEAVTVGGRSARQFRITEAQLPAGNLQQNTTYAIFFRPYTIHLPTGQREAWWPTIVTGTTTDERPEIPVTPTVPVLEPHESGDTWLTVRFRYSAALEYELRFSELLSDVPGGGRLIQNEELMAEGWAGTGEHSAYWFFTIPNLFPDTMHYIWMRSIGTSTTSDWSNPIAMSTLQLTAPIPPEALGLASQNNLNIINLENDLELIPVDSDYMIIEWLRNSNDLREPMGNEDVDGGQILGSPNIHHAYIVQFTDLIANRAHYVRARTVHMVSRSGVGGDVTRSYSYIVELSPNADFTDSVTIYVPSDETEFEENANRRVRISDWTQTFVFFTIRDDGEYDGDVRAELFPLPGHDFEIIYDRLTSTLTYRFRSDRTDASGNRDNLVDQRFISRLIQNRTFDFEIDLSTFDRNLVQNRVVEIPYSVISAFTERQISLSIQAGNTGYSFAPGFADSQEINAAGFGRDSRLRLEILQDNLNLPALQQNQRFISSPQRLDVNLVAPSASLRSTPINNLGAPVEISHRISAVDSMDRNIGAYRIGGDFSYWTRVDNDNFDQRTGMLSHSTTRLGNFAPIGVAAPVLTYGTDTATTNALMFVNSVMQIDGLVSLNPQDNINAWQANKLIAAAARGDNSVNVNDDLTEQELNSLTSARMLVPGDMTVSREDALAALVRLYEVRSGFPVLGHGDITSSGFADIGLASPNLQTAILKAEHLGFLGSSGLANPRGDLNFGDFIKIMEIILRNS